MTMERRMGVKYTKYINEENCVDILEAYCRYNSANDLIRILRS